MSSCYESRGASETTHVAFMRLHRRTAALYDMLRDAFWKALCGGRGVDDEGEDEHVNKRAAVLCAEHAWECRHPACGTARIRENEHVIEELCADEPERDPASALDETDDALLWMSDPSGCIEFCGGLETGVFARVGAAEGDVREIRRVSTLEAHPIVERSLASFPPCKTVRLKTSENLPAAVNEHGVTVADLVACVMSMCVSALCTSFSIVLTVAIRRGHSSPRTEVFSWLRHSVYGDDPEVLPKTWTAPDILYFVSTTFGRFQVEMGRSRI